MKTIYLTFAALACGLSLSRPGWSQTEPTYQNASPLAGLTEAQCLTLSPRQPVTEALPAGPSSLETVPVPAADADAANLFPFACNYQGPFEAPPTDDLEPGAQEAAGGLANSSLIFKEGRYISWSLEDI
jgi:hypothetical protein